MIWLRFLDREAICCLSWENKSVAEDGRLTMENRGWFLDSWGIRALSSQEEMVDQVWKPTHTFIKGGARWAQHGFCDCGLPSLLMSPATQIAPCSLHLQGADRAVGAMAVPARGALTSM